MKENFKNIILILLILSVFVLKPQTAHSSSFYAPEKKEFNTEEYKKLKEEVDLIEKMELKKLHEDSSQFGMGYGVEKGDQYTVYFYDSITGTNYYSEKNRGSGSKNQSDGVQPDSRNSDNKKQFQRRTTQDRKQNRKRQIRDDQLKRVQQKKFLDEPRASKENKSNQSGDGMRLLLILLIAIIIGAVVYMLFINSPIQGFENKILYDDKMNPNSIRLSELEIKIKRAKESDDFRLATRLYFVWVIKELSDKGYIQWRKRKTNYNYQTEVIGESFAKDFGISIKNYELIWYGKYNIIIDDFKVIERNFKLLIDKIR